MFSTTQVLCNNFESSSAPPPTPPPTDNLIYFCKFDSGDVVNSTLANYATGVPVYSNTTIYGNPSNPTISTTTYKVGTGSMYFIVTQNVSFQNTITISSSAYNNGFSICFWAMPQSTGNTLRTVWNGFQIGYGVAWRIRFSGSTIQYLGYNSNFTSGTVDDGNWHHYVFVISSSGPTTIYIDNVNVGSCATTYPPNATYNFYLAQNVVPYNSGTSSATETYKGYIDDFRMYSRVLTVAEIKAIYKNTT